MNEPGIIPGPDARGDAPAPAVGGASFVMEEWSGSGPDYLHVHYHDDEAWHILEGVLIFRFLDREIEAPAGTTVFVPAGVAHSYHDASGSSRYLIILTPRLRALISALHAAPVEQHQALMRAFDSEILDGTEERE